MADRSIQALIVEDHPLVRQGVLRLLMDEWPRCSILECGDVQEARRLLAERDWDFVLLDHRLPGGDGLDLVTKVRRPNRILVVSVDSSQELMHKAKELGCGGFVGKSEPPTNFLVAVRAVVAGAVHFPKLDPDSRPVRLSPRELQICKALLQGKPAFQIAAELGLTYGSVQTYKDRIFKKYGVTTLLELQRKVAHLP
jgi:two-component system invasion response regulator UvrY